MLQIFKKKVDHMLEASFDREYKAALLNLEKLHDNFKRLSDKNSKSYGNVFKLGELNKSLRDINQKS